MSYHFYNFQLPNETFYSEYIIPAIFHIITMIIIMIMTNLKRFFNYPMESRLLNYKDHTPIS